MEDTLFVLEYLEKFGEENIKISDAKYYYIQNQNSITKSKNTYSNIKNITKSIFETKKMVLENKFGVDSSEIINILNKKHVKIIEYEMGKISSLEEFLKLKKSSTINNIFDSLSKENIGFLGKIYLKNILKIPYFVFDKYILLRNLAKKILKKR